MSDEETAEAVRKAALHLFGRTTSIDIDRLPPGTPANVVPLFVDDLTHNREKLRWVFESFLPAAVQVTLAHWHAEAGSGGDWEKMPFAQSFSSSPNLPFSPSTCDAIAMHIVSEFFRCAFACHLARLGHGAAALVVSWAHESSMTLKLQE